ncbi:MAG: hypothetical protein SynsKO_38270 [Synoicihabitans sp.]
MRRLQLASRLRLRMALAGWLAFGTLALTSSAAADQNGNWDIASYNFGALMELGPDEQIATLRQYGYDALTLRVAKTDDFENLPRFLAAADQYEDFRIHAAFVRYNFEDEEFKETWREVVDQIAERDIQLWVVYGKPVQGYDEAFVLGKTREIVDYAIPREVPVVIYPHSNCFFESAEEAMPLVEKFSAEELSVAFHLYHEIRASHGHRIPEVITNIKHRLNAVTLAGTDVAPDRSSPQAINASTVRRIGEGDYNLNGLIQALYQCDYRGPISIMNFKMTEALATYLPASRDLLQDCIDQNRP